MKPLKPLSEEKKKEITDRMAQALDIAAHIYRLSRYALPNLTIGILAVKIYDEIKENNYQ